MRSRYLHRCVIQAITNLLSRAADDPGTPSSSSSSRYLRYSSRCGATWPVQSAYSSVALLPLLVRVVSVQLASPAVLLLRHVLVQRVHKSPDRYLLRRDPLGQLNAWAGSSGALLCLPLSPCLFPRSDLIHRRLLFMDQDSCFSARPADWETMESPQ
jgi:hypothetical protein